MVHLQLQQLQITKKIITYRLPLRHFVTVTLRTDRITYLPTLSLMKILHTNSKYLVQDNSEAPSEKCKIADTTAKRDISWTAKSVRGTQKLS